MKKEVKVSIIIPIYNGKKFIDQCLRSVLNQTYRNIEIILTDDGSTDGSLDIIKQYAEKHQNIKYDTHKNVGLSITRNIAFKNVTGDYVTYLDVDDYLDRDFIEKMLEDNKNFDIIIGGYRRVSEKKDILFEYSLNDSIWGRYKRVTVWAKLYKVSFLKKNKISYADTRIFGEDVIFTINCLSHTEKVIIKPYIGYNNLINQESITHKENHKIFNDVPKVISIIDNNLFLNKKYIRNNENIVKFYYMKIVAAYLIDLAYFKEEKDLLKYYHTNRNKIISIYKKYGYKQKIKWMKNEKISVNTLIKLLIISEKLHLINPFIKKIHKKFYKRKDD